ncbi:MAG: stage IV sporulation protein A [Clostridia bacterium]|nr:stage IV sporulation protein A [Clostridia bacterium]
MTDTSIYQDIATRTGGDIYIGVVGPVRSGKSTFIKRFMDTLVIPNIESEYRRERANDELPQSAAGRTIMTTEPKFIPEEAVEVQLGSNASFRVRMIDCVGYIVPSSLGYIENDQPRMVMTPWYPEEIPFNMAAEIGTQKVISEHSTIGLVITTDASISEIPRDEYEEAEERVISELKQINKPFVMLLNCLNPYTQEVAELAERLRQKYDVPVIPVNCMDLEEQEIRSILEQILFEFPLTELKFKFPKWITRLPEGHWLKTSVYDAIRELTNDFDRIRNVNEHLNLLSQCEYLCEIGIERMDLGRGSATVRAALQSGLFYRVLAETTGFEISDEQELMNCMTELAIMKKQYEKFRYALEEVEATGYGIVMPSLDELSLEEPEIVKQGNQYGVRLKAAAPSIHLMKADIQTEVSPIVGSERQSEDLVRYLLHEFEEDPQSIWGSNIFGKSLHELVNEGLHSKLNHMPSDARRKLRETLERVINEGCSGLICIIL